MPQIVEESALRLEFDNGSRVVALPGTEQTVRGFSAVSLLILDEASVIDDSLFQGVKPMLAVSKGRIILLSTPLAKRGFFFDVWENGVDWMRTRITALQCPRITKEWLERERAAIPEFWYQQEYMCQFVETEDSVFSFDDIHAALDSTIKPLFGER